MGADDYIAKPFSQRLLIARIRAILRRQELAAARRRRRRRRARAALLVRGRLAMDPARHKVLLGRQGRDADRHRIPDPRGAGAAARAWSKSRNQLLDIAYQDDVYVDDRTIDSHIKRMRRKFRAVDPEFDAIETLYGVGYRFGEE